LRKVNNRVAIKVGTQLRFSLQAIASESASLYKQPKHIAHNHEKIFVQWLTLFMNWQRCFKMGSTLIAVLLRGRGGSTLSYFSIFINFQKVVFLEKKIKEGKRHICTPN